MYTSRGYAVIMINPHGSVGFGDKFQDDVRFNWGGVPYEDIMMGVYVESDGGHARRWILYADNSDR